MLRLVDQVGRGEPVEDALVELKADWVDPIRAARRLAGHANAARGQDILWVVGLDEVRGVVGAEARERAAWWNSVQAEFDDVSPDLTDLNLLVGDKTVVALHFKTDRAPYVVRNAAYGSTKGDGVQFEVPWRAGTAVRSARRQDLVRLLIPILAVPQLAWLNGHVWAKREEGLPPDQRAELPDFVRGAHLLWRCGARLYVTPTTADRIVLPTHLCSAVAKDRGGGPGAVSCVAILGQP